MTCFVRRHFKANLKGPYCVAVVFLFVGLLLFANCARLHATEQDRLRDAIYQHNKTVLETNRAKFGGLLQPADYVIDNTYRKARVDLNDDKIEDAIVLFDSPGQCGSGGCNMEIYKGTKTGFEFVSGSTITFSPIRVGSERLYGWKTLIVLSGGTGTVLLRFNGSRYPLNPSLQPKATKSQIDSATIVLNDKK
jgi:hypothetical protein